MELDPVRLQLIRLLEVKDTNMRAASVAIGMNPAYLHQFIFRGTPKVLPRKIRSLLAKHLGVEEKVLTHADSRAKAHSPSGARGNDESQPRRRHNAVEIHEIDVRASAGPGAINEGLEDATATWLFPEAVVRHELRAAPEHLRMITIDGDSMEPLLSAVIAFWSTPVSASRSRRGYSSSGTEWGWSPNGPSTFRTPIRRGS